jgi:electron transport complex protein RnfE
MTDATDATAPASAGRTAGLWPLVRLLGLAPLLGVSTSAVKGAALGVATTVVLIAANGITGALGPLLLPRARVMFHVMISAVAVTCLDWLTNAGLHALHEALGVFLPLIVANGILDAEAAGAARGRPFAVLGRAVGLGLAFTATLAALGALRELVGGGTVLADLDLLGAPPLTLHLPFDGARVALLPAGGFFAAAALLALYQYLAARSKLEQSR